MPYIAVVYNPNTTHPIEVCPQPVHVKGKDAILTWVPVNCTFPPTGGIVFAADTVDPTDWPYAQPTLGPDGTYQVVDPNPHIEGAPPITYNYNVTIISNGGTPHTRMDPDVTNTPE